MNVKSSMLLELPSEIRNQIWTYSFANTQVGHIGDQHIQFPSECEPCSAFKLQSGESLATYRSAAEPLRTCKQIYQEAFTIFYSMVNVHISEPDAFVAIFRSSTDRHRRALCSHLRYLTLYLHFDDDVRMVWFTLLNELANTLPTLRHLVVHNHMRTPTSYDRLVDGAFVAGPMVVFANRVACTPQAPPPADGTASSMTLDSSIPADAAAAPSSLTLYNGYLQAQEVIFDTDVYGPILGSDALIEHSAVIREAMTDPSFVCAAIDTNPNDMAIEMLRIARGYERAWLQRLQRDRMMQAFIEQGATREQAREMVDREMALLGEEEEEEEDDDDDEDDVGAEM